MLLCRFGRFFTPSIRLADSRLYTLLEHVALVYFIIVGQRYLNTYNMAVVNHVQINQPLECRCLSFSSNDVNWSDVSRRWYHSSRIFFRSFAVILQIMNIPFVFFCVC